MYKYYLNIGFKIMVFFKKKYHNISIFNRNSLSSTMVIYFILQIQHHIFPNGTFFLLYIQRNIDVSDKKNDKIIV